MPQGRAEWLADRHGRHPGPLRLCIQSNEVMSADLNQGGVFSRIRLPVSGLKGDSAVRRNVFPAFVRLLRKMLRRYSTAARPPAAGREQISFILVQLSLDGVYIISIP